MHSKRKLTDVGTSFLKDVTISYRSKPNGELKNHTVKFHRKLEGNLQGLFKELANHPDFYIHEFGTYDYRNVVGSSTPKLSNHSYGIAYIYAFSGIV